MATREKMLFCWEALSPYELTPDEESWNGRLPRFKPSVVSPPYFATHVV